MKSLLITVGNWAYVIATSGIKMIWLDSLNNGDTRDSVPSPGPNIGGTFTKDDLLLK